MRLIRTGMQIGTAVKNVQRLRQIIAVFTKYGYADVVQRMNLGKFLPRGQEPGVKSTTQEGFRRAFEELGPVFVKFGQLLSTRPDLVPEAYLKEFVRLQDNVAPLAFDVIKKTVETELGMTLEGAFAFFDPTPLASASIGQVHEARLHSGEKVVVKVQRPEIERIIETDISLLSFLAGLLDKYVPESRVFQPKVVVEEFFRTISLERNFMVEANNIMKSARNMESIPEIVVPKVYKRFSTMHVLTLEKLEGIRVNDLQALDAAGIDRKKVAEIGARAFFKSVMLDGLFHGDLHGGNLFVLPGNKIGIIDFGIMGRLSQKARDQLANMVVALLTEDFERLCFQYAELASAGPVADFDSFQREVRHTLAPYFGLTLDEINAGQILIEATRIAAKHNIRVPGDWMIVFKAIVTIEGMGRTLDPEFDVLATGQDLAKELVKNQYSVQKLTTELLWVAKDAASLMQVLPRQVRWMLRKLNANDFAIEVKVPEVDRLRRQMEANGRRLSLSVLVGGLFVASALSLQHASGPMLLGHPLMATVFFGLGVGFLIRLLFF